eukprot:scaffold81686_cov24-Phaeocystis_antarctica.AAC.1
MTSRRPGPHPSAAGEGTQQQAPRRPGLARGMGGHRQRVQRTNLRARGRDARQAKRDISQSDEIMRGFAGGCHMHLEGGRRRAGGRAGILCLVQLNRRPTVHGLITRLRGPSGGATRLRDR